MIEMLLLAKKIITEINGPEALGTIPVELYDLSCNTILPVKLDGGLSNERHLEMIRVMDDYGRRRDIGYGKRKRKRSTKRKKLH
jgi:hypothetical protein